jgi:hypothetical protein
MEPQVQYAKTSDGVSIAFWTLREGTPLLSMPSVPFSHIQAEWQDPENRVSYELLARTREFVGYDGRGTGLPQRDTIDFSLWVIGEGTSDMASLTGVSRHISLGAIAPNERGSVC